MRLDRRTGEKTTVVSGYADVPARDQPERRRISFATTIDAVPRLIRGTSTGGRDRILYTASTTQGASGPGTSMTFPATPSRPTSGRRLHRRRQDPAGRPGLGRHDGDPVHGRVELTVTEILNPKHELSDGPFSPKVLHWVQALGANELIVGAAGKLYRYDTKSRRRPPTPAAPASSTRPRCPPMGDGSRTSIGSTRSADGS